MKGWNSFDHWFWKRILSFINKPRDWHAFSLVCKDFAQLCRQENETRQVQFSVTISTWMKMMGSEAKRFAKYETIPFPFTEPCILPNGWVRRACLWRGPVVMVRNVSIEIGSAEGGYVVEFWDWKNLRRVSGFKCEACQKVHCFYMHPRNSMYEYTHVKSCFATHYTTFVHYDPESIPVGFTNPIARAVIAYAKRIKEQG